MGGHTLQALSARAPVAAILGLLLIAGALAQIRVANESAAAYLASASRAALPSSHPFAGPWDMTQLTGMPGIEIGFGPYYVPATVLFRVLPISIAFATLVTLHNLLAMGAMYGLARLNGSCPRVAFALAVAAGLCVHAVLVIDSPSAHQSASWLTPLLLGLECFRRGESWAWVVVAATCLAAMGLTGDVLVMVTAMTAVVALGAGTVSVGPAAGARMRFIRGGLAVLIVGTLGACPQLVPLLEVVQWQLELGVAPADWAAKFAPFLLASLAILLIGVAAAATRTGRVRTSEAARRGRWIRKFVRADIQGAALPGMGATGVWCWLLAACLSACWCRFVATPRRLVIAGRASIVAPPEFARMLGKDSTSFTTLPGAAGWRANEPLRCLVDPSVTSRGESILTAGDPNRPAWMFSTLDARSGVSPASLARLLQLDSSGRPDFQSMAASERGLSAAAARFVVSQGPLMTRRSVPADPVASLHDIEWKLDGAVSQQSNVALEAGGTISAKLVFDPRMNFLLDFELDGESERQTATLVLRGRQSQRLLVDERVAIEKCPAGLGGIVVPFQTDAETGVARLIVKSEHAFRIRRLDIWRVTAEVYRAFAALDKTAQIWKLRGGTGAYRLIGHDRSSGVQVYENPLARSLLQFITTVEFVDSNQKAAALAASPLCPSRLQHAYVTANAADPLTGRTKSFGDGKLTVNTYWSDEASCSTDAASETFVAFATTRARGWRAKIDGHNVPIASVDGAWMGVVVPAGRHLVQFRYRPVLAGLGLTLAGIGLGGAWILIIVILPRSRRTEWVRLAVPQSHVLRAGVACSDDVSVSASTDRAQLR